MSLYNKMMDKAELLLKPTLDEIRNAPPIQCSGLADTKINRILDSANWPSVIEYKLSNILRGILCGYYSGSRSVKLHPKIVEDILEVYPDFFDKVNIIVSKE